MTQRLRVNPVACSGHGLCAELLPELITLDEWGYPLITDADLPAGLARRARRAVTDCPALALMLPRGSSGSGTGTGTGGGPAAGAGPGASRSRANSEQVQNASPG